MLVALVTLMQEHEAFPQVGGGGTQQEQFKYVCFVVALVIFLHPQLIPLKVKLEETVVTLLIVFEQLQFNFVVFDVPFVTLEHIHV